MNNHIKQLDVFRALAALSVCAVHFTYDTFFTKYFAQGLFVQLFFTLSGFVICLNYIEKLQKISVFKSFLIKRFKRLYPLHLFFLIIFGIIELLKYFVFLEYGIEANNKVFETNNFKNFLLNLFFLQHFAESYSFNTPSWSISVEIMLYISFGILTLLSRKLIFFVCFLYVIYFLIFLNNLYGSALSLNAFYSGFFSFSIGCLFCLIYKKKNFYFHKKIPNFLYFFLIFIFLIEIFYFRKLSNYSYLYSIIFGLIFYISCFLNSNFVLYKFFFNKFFIYLGKISYSIYLSHLLIFYLLNNTLRFVLKIPTNINKEGDIVLDLTVLEAHLYTIIAYMITIAFSHFTYKNIEMKFYKK